MEQSRKALWSKLRGRDQDAGERPEEWDLVLSAQPFKARGNVAHCMTCRWSEKGWGERHIQEGHWWRWRLQAWCRGQPTFYFPSAVPSMPQNDSYTSIQELRKSGLPWWLSSKETTCQCRRHRFDSWSRKIPYAMEQLSPCATTTEPVRCNNWNCAPKSLRPTREATALGSWRAITESSSYSLQLEKTAHTVRKDSAQQRRTN